MQIYRLYYNYLSLLSYRHSMFRLLCPTIFRYVLTEFLLNNLYTGHFSPVAKLQPQGTSSTLVSITHILNLLERPRNIARFIPF